jgi:hypothetical protein
MWPGASCEAGLYPGPVRRTGILAVLMLALGGALTPAVHAADQRAWTLRALDLQYELGSDLGLANAPWVYTHNAFNSRAELGPRSVSANDPNQILTVVGQLDEGVRHIEIDTHLFPSPSDPRVGALGPVVCHSTEQHAGCSGEKSLVAVLSEVRGWLRAHPRQVILLYLESHLDTVDGYAAGADEVEEALGDVLYKPPAGGGCTPMPLDVSRNQIRRAGKQVLAIGPCGLGPRWPALVFDESPRLTGDDNNTFRDFPDCGPDFTRAKYEASPIRYYEDSTQVSANVNGGTDPITAPIAARMTRCGVDLLGFDMLTRGDPRLAAVVWSWAPGEPAPGRDCAVQRPDGRWAARPCGERHRVACRDATGYWRIPAGRASARAAARLCGRPGLTQGVPHTGYEGQRLKASQARAGAGEVWLGHRRRGDGGKAYERKGCGPSLRRSGRRRLVRHRVVSTVVRLGFVCTGERLNRPIVVRGGQRAVRSRTGRAVRIRVGPHTRELRVGYSYRGKRRAVTVLLRRR